MPFRIGREEWRFEVRASWKCDKGVHVFAWAETLESAMTTAEDLKTWQSVKAGSVHIVDKKPQLNGYHHEV